MNKFYMDEPAKWKTRILLQIHTADPLDMGRKSHQYTLFHCTVDGEGRGERKEYMDAKWA